LISLVNRFGKLRSVWLVKFHSLAKIFFNWQSFCFASVLVVVEPVETQVVFFWWLPKIMLCVKVNQVGGVVFLWQSSLAFREVA